MRCNFPIDNKTFPIVNRIHFGSFSMFIEWYRIKRPFSSSLCSSLINRAAMGGARFLIYLWFINRAAMGRARFFIYPWFIFFFVCRLNQTSLGQNSNNAIYVGGQTQTSIRPNRVRDFETRNLWCLFAKSCWNINRGKMLRTLVNVCKIYFFRFFQHLFCLYLESRKS